MQHSSIISYRTLYLKCPKAEAKTMWSVKQTFHTGGFLDERTVRPLGRKISKDEIKMRDYGPASVPNTYLSPSSKRKGWIFFEDSYDSSHLCAQL